MADIASTWIYLEDREPFETLNVSARPEIAGLAPPAEIDFTDPATGERRTFRLQNRYSLPESP